MTDKPTSNTLSHVHSDENSICYGGNIQLIDHQLSFQKNVKTFVRLKLLIASIMILEVWLESAPQLGTQWEVIMIQFIGQARANRSRSVLPFVSVATSTFTITLAIVNFVARSRREEWIKPGHPAVASLTPIGLLAISAVIVATLQLIFMTSGYFLAMGLNIAAVFLTVSVICMPCRSGCLRSRCWRVMHTLIHFVLTGGSLAWNSMLYATDTRMFDYDRNALSTSLFRFLLFCQVIHFLLGLIIFFGINAARLFAPIFVGLGFLFRKFVNSRCCRENWRP